VLSKFFESLYNKVFVNIVVKRSSTDVYIELGSKKGTLENAQKSFDTTLLNSEMLAFINTYTKESPYYYVSILDVSTEQGAIPTCTKNKLPLYYDLSASEYRCYDNKWSYYTSKTDLYALEKMYSKIGLDFIFSPFSLLANFFADKINAKVAMYILVQDSFISLSVFENSELLYAEHLDMETTNESEDEMLSQSIDEEEIDLSDDEAIDLDDVDAIDDLEDLEDFGNIEDLDSIEEIDEFSENQDIEEKFYEAAEPELESNETVFNEDYQRFSLIHTSISHFYNENKYASKFVENVYIADGAGVSNDLKHYLEEEMFLNVYVRHIDIGMELSNLAKMELN